MQNFSDPKIAELEREWPNWQFWLVPAYIGPTAWCARRHDDHQRVLNADSARELAEMLEAEASR
jgi:hypothetical protein